MKIIRSIKQMQKISLALKNKKTVAVVPTMGFLHAGHLSLVKIAQKKAQVVIVTLFVNPTQFGPNEDFSHYPTDLKKDIQLLKDLKVDYLFMPHAKDMYPAAFQTTVLINGVTQPLCGKSRPGHFSGVTTVVLKLFQLTQPTFAVFGKKDFQQLVVIQTMVRDLNLPVKVLAGKIVREKDGLALSSRNVYLNTQERSWALGLSQGLQKVRQASQKKSLTPIEIKKIFKQNLVKHKSVRLDYIECLYTKTLTPLKKSMMGKTLVAVAVYIGRTRLIDNIVI